MKCETARSWIDAYVDGELPEASAGEVAAHLESCTCCQQELAAVQRVSEGTRKFQAECPAGLRERAWTAMQPDKPSSSWIAKIKENMTMRRYGMKIGVLAGALSIAAIAMLTMTPRKAEASWATVTAALKQVTNVKVTLNWSDGEHGGSKVIWTRNDLVRMDYANGLVMMYRDGKTYEWGSGESFIDNGLHLGPIDPEDFAVGKLISTQAGHVTPVNEGVVQWHGRSLQLLGIDTQASDGRPAKRYEVLVDPATNLPVRFVEYNVVDGERRYDNEMLFEFNVNMPDSMFVPPAGARKVDSPAPDGPVGHIIG